MNKKIYLLLIIPIIIFIQIINIIRDAKYNWDIIIFEILLIFIVLIIFVLFNIRKYKKIVQHFNNKDYAYVINTKRLIFPKKSIQLHYFYYMKAVSCMETNDFSNFKIYIDKIENESLLMTKIFLNLLYAYIIKDGILINENKSKLRNIETDNNDLKNRCDKIISLIEKNEPLTEEEIAFSKTIQFKQIIQLIFK